MNKLKLGLLGFIAVMLFMICGLMALPYIKGEGAHKHESQYTASATKVVKREQESDAAKLEHKLNKLDLVVKDAAYVVQSAEYKALYPDMLMAEVKNNTDKDIKTLIIGYVGWDKNGMPVHIKGNIDFNSNYFKGAKAEAVNLAPGEVFGEDKGLQLSADNEIHSFKPFVVAYEDFEGKRWKNPYAKEINKIYVCKRLKDIKGYKAFIYYKDGSTKETKAPVEKKAQKEMLI